MPPGELLGGLNAVEELNAPTRLYLSGRRELLSNTLRVAVVGSRGASPDGIKRAAKLARLLSRHGAIVISGLAEGVDTAAHVAAMESGGSTIAVIGTPLDVVYPRSNAELQKRIAQNHLVVSEFPSGHPVTRSNFPRRNRTMALLCHASVIVEAGDSSGSLSQGFEALRLGRPLFLMRSVLKRPGLKWPAEMLKYGAIILEEPDQIAQALPPGGGELPATAAF